MYLYDAIDRSENRDVLQRLEESAVVVAERLQAIDYDALDISDYTKKYIRGYLRNIRGVLQIYTHLMYIAMESCQFSNLNDYVFVDYGGGTGIMSLLALEFGFGTVLYVDIYDVSCRDAELISEKFGAKATKYICGDIDALCEYVSASNVFIDVLVSYDVIEHIYDVESFFGKINTLNSEHICVVCASSANIYNPFIRWKRMDCHRKTEIQDRRCEWGHKERDSLRSYFAIRREIISSVSPGFSEDVIEMIARNTRGLRKDDIEKCVQQYAESGDFTYRPTHPTNTCDPYIGNWNERLMNFSYLTDILEQNGFVFSWVCGYYGYSLSPLRKACKIVLNSLIAFFGRHGFFLAPYYVLRIESRACLRSGSCVIKL